MDFHSLAKKNKNRIIAFFKRIYSKTTGVRLKTKLGKKNTIILIVSVVVVLLASAAGCYFYFYIYRGSNFGDDLFNNVVTSSMKEIEPGDTLNYKVNYKNTGYREVDALDIEISIPDNTELVTFGEGGNFNEDKKILTYSFENIARDSSGSIEFSLEVDNPLDKGTVINLEEVKLTYSMKGKEFYKILESKETHVVESSPDFSYFSISSLDENGGFLSLGDKIKYTIKIKNTGNMVARDIQIHSSISSFLDLDPDSIGQSGIVDGETLVWQLVELEPGDLKIFNFTASLKTEGLEDREEIITNAELIYDGEKSDEEYVEDTARLFPDFSESTATFADANGGGYLWAGETVNIRITIKNTGQRKADEYQLYCPIPEQATYVSKSGTAEGIRWDDETRGLVWDLSGLEVGESRDISFNMTVNSDYYYRSSTISSGFYIISGKDDFPIEPASIYVQGHPNLNIVAMGDSLIALSDWVQRLDNKLEAAFPSADYNTTASAISGEMSFEGLSRYNSTVGPLHPTILIVAYGSNDVGISQSYFSYSIDNIIARGKGQGATVFINTIGPMSNPGKSDWPVYNSVIMQVANKHGIPVVDVTSPLSQNKGGYLRDGLHYTTAGAEVVAQAVFNSIVPYLNGLGGRR